MEGLLFKNMINKGYMNS